MQSWNSNPQTQGHTDSSCMVELGFRTSHIYIRTVLLITLSPSKLLTPQNTAAATTKSLQSCPTLRDPINGSPLGSSVPGILQARILEWVAISFSNAWKWKVKVKLFSRAWLLATPWTAAHQAPPSMGFSRQEYWSGLPLPSPPEYSDSNLKKYTHTSHTFVQGFHGGSDSKESACNAGDPGLIPGSERSPGEGNGNPLQCSCLGNPMARGAWQSTVHEIAESDSTEWLTLSLTFVQSNFHIKLFHFNQFDLG